MVIGLILASLMLTNPLKPVVYNVNSNVISSLTGDLYGDVLLKEYAPENGYIGLYSYNFNTDSLDFEDNFVCDDITDFGQFLSDVYGNLQFENYVYGSNNYIYIFVGYKDKGVNIDGHYIDTWVRFANYSTNKVNSIEVYNNNGYSLLSPAYTNSAVIGNNIYTDNFNSTRVLNWFGAYYFDPIRQFKQESNITFSQGSMPDYMFDTLFGFESQRISVDLKFDVEFRLCDFDYNDAKFLNAYNQGYDDGKYVGTTEGYQKGYQAAKDLYYQAPTFYDLFGAIADTPIKMLYGLFNFDLFGISVITIVLTTLTAVVLFGILKRFIK